MSPESPEPPDRDDAAGEPPPREPTGPLGGDTPGDPPAEESSPGESWPPGLPSDAEGEAEEPGPAADEPAEVPVGDESGPDPSSPAEPPPPGAAGAEDEPEDLEPPAPEPPPRSFEPTWPGEPPPPADRPIPVDAGETGSVPEPPDEPAPRPPDDLAGADRPLEDDVFGYEPEPDDSIAEPIPVPPAAVDPDAAETAAIPPPPARDPGMAPTVGAAVPPPPPPSSSPSPLSRITDRVDPRLLILLGVVVIAVVAALLLSGGDDESAAPGPAVVTEPAPAVTVGTGTTTAPTTTTETTPVPAADAPPAGWKRVRVPAGVYTVDVPPGYREAVSGPLITFVSTAQRRAYSVNGKADDATTLPAAQRSLVAGYRRTFSLGRVNATKIGAREVRVSVTGRRRSGRRESQRILAAIVRPPGSDRGLYIVQSFSGPGTAGGRKAALAEFRLVRAALQIGR